MLPLSSTLVLWAQNKMAEIENKHGVPKASVVVSESKLQSFCYNHHIILTSSGTEFQGWMNGTILTKAQPNIRKNALQ